MTRRPADVTLARPFVPRVIEVDPRVEEIDALRRQGRLADAGALAETLAADPVLREQPMLWRYIARIWDDHGDLDAAMRAARVHLGFGPAMIRPWFSYAELCFRAGQWREFREAVALAWKYRKVAEQLADQPPGEFIGLYTVKAMAALANGEPALARDMLREVVARTPTEPHDALSVAVAHCALAPHESASWAAWEQRLALRGPEQRAADNWPDRPMWDGQTPGRVVVVQEQGAGDLMQVLRYLPMIAERSGQPVTVRCHAPMQRLVRAIPGVDRVLDDRVAIPESAHWVLDQSLPHVMGVFPLPPQVALGKALAWTAPVGAWTRRAPRIGLCWSGNPKLRHSQARNAPMESLAALKDALPGATWQAVQPGSVPPWCTPYRGHDFHDNAMLMRGLDAVISVDSGPAHLAALVGVPTVVVPMCLPHGWFGIDKVSAWAPDVTIVRRAKVDDWREVWQRVGRVLMQRWKQGVAA